MNFAKINNTDNNNNNNKYFINTVLDDNLHNWWI